MDGSVVVMVLQWGCSRYWMAPMRRAPPPMGRGYHVVGLVSRACFIRPVWRPNLIRLSYDAHKAGLTVQWTLPPSLTHMSVLLCIGITTLGGGRRERCDLCRFYGAFLGVMSRCSLTVSSQNPRRAKKETPSPSEYKH